MKIPRRRNPRAMQIIDADHVLERLGGAERSFCLDPYPVGLMRKPPRSCASPRAHCIVRPGGNEAMPCFKISRIGLMSRGRRRCRIKDHLHVARDAWPRGSKQQHHRLALLVSAANIGPEPRLRGIFGGLLLLFRLRLRCLGGSSHVDHEKQATSSDKMDTAALRATQYSGLMSLMTFLMISMLPTHLRASAACRLPGSSFARHARAEAAEVRAVEAMTFSYRSSTAVWCGSG